MTANTGTVTRTIDCPLFCAGGKGTAAWSFMGGSATITCCTKCNGGAFKVPVTAVEYYLPKAEPVHTYQHSSGLVTLTGSI